MGEGQEEAPVVLAGALSSYLTDRCGRAVEVNGLTRLSGGWESDVFAFNAPAWQSDAQILRLYFGSNAGATALREYRALDLLAQGGYPVPRVTLVEPSPQELGKSFLTMEKVEGKPLGNRWRDPDLRVRQREIERFCALFVQLHTLEWQNLAGAEHLPTFTIGEQFAVWEQYLEMFPIASFQDALRWLRRASDEIEAQPLKLVHWDFHHENILIDEKDHVWVIDWTQFQATDPRFDLAWTLVLLASERDAQTAQEVRAEYFRQRGWTEDGMGGELGFFEAAASAKRLLSVLISLNAGAASVGMRPGSENILKSRLSRFATVYRRWLELTATPLPEVAELLSEHL